jgi:hypothetical protein
MPLFFCKLATPTIALDYISDEALLSNCLVTSPHAIGCCFLLHSGLLIYSCVYHLDVLFRLLLDFFNHQIIIFKNLLSLLLQSAVILKFVNLSQRISSMCYQILQEHNKRVFVQLDNELSDDFLLRFDVKSDCEYIKWPVIERFWLGVVPVHVVFSKRIIDFSLSELIFLIICLVDPILIAAFGKDFIVKWLIGRGPTPYIS